MGRLGVVTVDTHLLMPLRNSMLPNIGLFTLEHVDDRELVELVVAKSHPVIEFKAPYFTDPILEVLIDGLTAVESYFLLPGIGP